MKAASWLVPLSFYLVTLLLALGFSDSRAASPAPGGHLPLSYGGDNTQPYPALTPLDVLLPGPSGTMELRIAVVPNPFHGSTTIRLALAPGKTGSVEIFDLSGRLVRQLSARGGTQSSASVVWDGRSRSGSPARTGVYFLRVTTPDQARTARLVLLR